MGPSATNFPQYPNSPIFGLGTTDPGQGPADATLHEAAKIGTVNGGPWKPVTVKESGAAYFVQVDGDKAVTIPKNATWDNLDAAQRGALQHVKGALASSGPVVPPTVAADPQAGTSAGPKEKVDVKPKAQTTFDPTGSEFNTRFDQTIGRTDLKAAGDNRHYLGADDAAAVCKTLGFADVKTMQKALNAAGLKPPLVVDGKLGGRTLTALTNKVMADPAFAFPEIKTADDAKNFARVTELLVEQAGTTESATATGEFKTRLSDALTLAISKATPDVQKQIADAAAGMTSTGTGEGDAADAKSILTGSSKPDTGKIAAMSVDELITTMTRPGAMDGDSGTAIRTRLKDPAVLLKVAGNATAMANPVIAAEVKTAIGTLDAAGVSVVAKGLGKDAADSVRKDLLAQIDTLAAKLSSPSDIDTLLSLRESVQALTPVGVVPPSLAAAALRMVQAAELNDLEIKGGQTPAFREKLGKLYGSEPMPKSLTDGIATRIADLQAAAKAKVDDDRKALGNADDVNAVYWTIVGKMEDGISGKEDDAITAAITKLGEFDKGQMSKAGSARVGALIERLKANGKLDRMMAQYGNSERKDLLRTLAHLQPGSVSPETVAEITRLCVDKLGNDDAATKQVKGAAHAVFDHADAKDRAAMLLTMRASPDLARGYVTDPTNFPLLRESFPNGHIATTFLDTFENDEQRVAFMNALIDTIADKDAAPEVRKWATEALDDATVAFRKPLEDGDLEDVQTHLAGVIGRPGTAPDADAYLKGYYITLDKEKKIN